MPTVIIGSALDIVEHCGVPRFLFVDFPLGNPCGKPGDADMQRRIVRQGLSLFESADKPQTTVHCAERWGSDEWRARYMEVNEGNRAELARKGDELRQRRATRQRRS
ncbi:MAG: hypothetical protein GWM88_14265 [Pseudomonadales bacterium]|nr:hypothetical protein [Pseudomonadales bacterium]NIX09105.1 hypothetical protein [Pseudomonadales bacterium]